MLPSNSAHELFVELLRRRIPCDLCHPVGFEEGVRVFSDDSFTAAKNMILICFDTDGTVLIFVANDSDNVEVKSGFLPNTEVLPLVLSLREDLGFSGSRPI